VAHSPAVANPAAVKPLQVNLVPGSRVWVNLVWGNRVLAKCRGASPAPVRRAVGSQAQVSREQAKREQVNREQVNRAWTNLVSLVNRAHPNSAKAAHRHITPFSLRRRLFQ
jgi:hypothetical protein